MSTSNKAAWLPEKGARLKIMATEQYMPKAGEILVRNKSVAINPVDWKMQDSGYFISSYPVILGTDIAGEVAAVGEGISRFQTGQRVLAHVIGIETRKPSDGSFQTYSTVPAAAAAPIPDSMSFEAASVLPLGLSTAAAGLYQSSGLKLPFPSHNPKSTGKTILVWGGSSSVGASAIQLAVASGVEVVSTASKKNFDLVKKLGAKEVFDYADSNIVEDLVAYLKDKQVASAYDAIGENDTSMSIAQVLSKVGGGHFTSSLAVPKDLPATVTGSSVYAISIHVHEPAVGKALYVDFLPEALKTGQIKPLPEAKVVGHGLESLQPAVDLMKKGVSATKLVVTL